MPEPREILVQNLPEIERIIRSICWRKGVGKEDTEDLVGEVILRLIDDDYAVIRDFHDRSSFNTYIATMVTRLVIDYRRREWGKWRTSAEAKRLGELAMAFERMINRDHTSMSETFAALKEKFPGLTLEQLESLAARMPPRLPRRHVEIEEAVAVAAPTTGVDPIRADTARRLSETVSTLVALLPKDDQLLLRLCFDVGLSVAEIARTLHIDQAPLYPRLRKLFRSMRKSLEDAGFAAKDVEELIGTDSTLLDFHLKKKGVRTSEQEEIPIAVRKAEMSK